MLRKNSDLLGVQSKSAGHTAAHFAVTAGQEMILRLLHRLGFNFEQSNIEGLTPLQLAKKRMADPAFAGQKEALQRCVSFLTSRRHLDYWIEKSLFAVSKSHYSPSMATTIPNFLSEFGEFTYREATLSDLLSEGIQSWTNRQDEFSILYTGGCAYQRVLKQYVTATESRHTYFPLNYESFYLPKNSKMASQINAVLYDLHIHPIFPEMVKTAREVGVEKFGGLLRYQKALEKAEKMDIEHRIVPSPMDLIGTFKRHRSNFSRSIALFGIVHGNGNPLQGGVTFYYFTSSKEDGLDLEQYKAARLRNDEETQFIFETDYTTICQSLVTNLNKLQTQIRFEYVSLEDLKSCCGGQ